MFILYYQQTEGLVTIYFHRMEERSVLNVLLCSTKKVIPLLNDMRMSLFLDVLFL